MSIQDFDRENKAVGPIARMVMGRSPIAQIRAIASGNLGSDTNVKQMQAALRRIRDLCDGVGS